MTSSTSTQRPPTREATYEVEVVPDCGIECADGVRLSGDLFVPRDAPPRPALVTLLPYNKDGVGGVAAWDVNRYFAARGYPVLLVDFRGTGASGGVPRAPFSAEEAQDGATIVEWMARHPCCDGSVGMWGVSYGAITTLRTATLSPPALRAIIPIMGFLDPERDFVHPAGHRGYLASLGVWGLTTLAQHLAPPLRDDRDGSAERRWRRRLEDGEPALVDLLKHPPGDPEWEARRIDASQITTPAFCVAGWRDLNCEATIRAYEQIQGPKQLLVGPWMHTLPDESPFEAVDFLAQALDWWDRWLWPDPDPDPDADSDPDPDSADGTATIYLQGRGRWHELSDWPPEAEQVTLCAGADAALVEPGDAQAGIVSCDVDATVGIRAGLWGIPTRGFGLPRDQHEDDSRSIAFTGEPLEEALLICGRPQVTLAMAPSGEGPRTYVVKLAHVDADGRSFLITAGTAEGSLPVPARGEVKVDLITTAFEVPAGDRLRLVVSAADFARLWPDSEDSDYGVRCGPAATTLTLPVNPRLGPGVHLAAADPSVGHGSLVLRADPLYTVSHNAMTEAVTVTLGDHFLGRLPAASGTLDVNSFVSATVTPDRPQGAFLSGKSVTRSHTPRGEFVSRAELLISRDAAVVTGEVTFEDHVVFSRHWSL